MQKKYLILPVKMFGTHKNQEGKDFRVFAFSATCNVVSPYPIYTEQEYQEVMQSGVYIKQ